jgi:hypothetical protein
MTDISTLGTKWGSAACIANLAAIVLPYLLMLKYC